jgi:hypothetical protein
MARHPIMRGPEPAAPSADGDAARPKAQEEETFEFTTSQWFRLRVSSDEISVLVALFNMEAYGQGTDIGPGLAPDPRAAARVHPPA